MNEQVYDLMNECMQEFSRLADDMMQGRPTESGPTPPNMIKNQWSFLPPVIIDTAPIGALPYAHMLSPPSYCMLFIGKRLGVRVKPICRNLRTRLIAQDPGFPAHTLDSAKDLFSPARLLLQPQLCCLCQNFLQLVASHPTLI